MQSQSDTKSAVSPTTNTVELLSLPQPQQSTKSQDSQESSKPLEVTHDSGLVAVNPTTLADASGGMPPASVSTRDAQHKLVVEQLKRLHEQQQPQHSEPQPAQQPPQPPPPQPTTSSSVAAPVPVSVSAASTAGPQEVRAVDVRVSLPSQDGSSGRQPGPAGDSAVSKSRLPPARRPHDAAVQNPMALLDARDDQPTASLMRRSGKAAVANSSFGSQSATLIRSAAPHEGAAVTRTASSAELARSVAPVARPKPKA
jgi:hypothetical protein